MVEREATVVAVVERERLNRLLTAVHRHGYGHLARVIDPARGDLPGQLLRAGLRTDDPRLALGADMVALTIRAAARHAAATTLLLQHGASQAFASTGISTGAEGAACASMMEPRPRKAAPIAAALPAAPDEPVH